MLRKHEIRNSRIRTSKNLNYTSPAKNKRKLYKDSKPTHSWIDDGHIFIEIVLYIY